MIQNLEPGDPTSEKGAVSGASDVWNKRITGIAVALIVLILVLVLYLQFGLPTALRSVASPSSNESSHATSQEQISGRAAALADRLKAKPDDVEGWRILARSYITLGQFSEAADAYSHLVRLNPGNAELLADYADTMAMSRNKSLLGEPEKLIEKALALDPKNIKALALSASASYQARDYAAAVGQWRKILVLVPPESELARSTMSSIGEAQNLAEQSSKAALPRPSGGSSMPAKALIGQAGSDSSNPEVSGTVQLDAGLRSKVVDTDTVFIYVRAVEGPGFPLAVLRKQVRDLPTNFELDNRMGVEPHAKISAYSFVIVGARVSRSGNASPGVGDLEGQSEPVRPGAKNIVVRINRIRS